MHLQTDPWPALAFTPNPGGAQKGSQVPRASPRMVLSSHKTNPDLHSRPVWPSSSHPHPHWGPESVTQHSRSWGGARRGSPSQEGRGRKAEGELGALPWSGHERGSAGQPNSRYLRGQSGASTGVVRIDSGLARCDPYRVTVTPGQVRSASTWQAPWEGCSGQSCDADAASSPWAVGSGSKQGRVRRGNPLRLQPLGSHEAICP